MNYTKPSVTGIDIPIQKLQNSLYGKIQTLWSVNDSTFNMYGRAYRNQRDGAYIPEVYTGGNDYKDSYFDDTLSGSAFFGLADTEKVVGASVTANVFIIFMVDLSKIKPGDTRNDEEARVDIERIVSGRAYGFFMSGIVTGIDQVFKEYSIKQISFRDMHPWHCFRINFNITYNINDCK